MGIQNKQCLIATATKQRPGAYLQTQDPFLIDENTFVAILSLSHNLDVRQRRPHVLFEHGARKKHALLHLERHPIPIRQLLAPIAPPRLATRGRPPARGAHRIRIKVPHYDWRRSSRLRRDGALAGRRRYPTYRRVVALEPPRHSGTPRGPGYLLRRGSGLGLELGGGVVEGRTCALRCGDVREERAAVHDERERSRLGEVEQFGVQVRVFDQHVEQDDRVLHLVAEGPVRRGRDRERTGTDGVWFGAASETDDRGASGEGREA